MLHKNVLYLSEILFPYANLGKSIEIEVENEKYMRHVIKTHFIKAGEENYIDIIQRYALPVYRKGDILFISKKIITLCQNRVITKKELKLGFGAKYLSRFFYKNTNDFSIKEPHKMALAIKISGLPNVLFAGLCSTIGKLFGIRELFYRVVGYRMVSGVLKI